MAHLEPVLDQIIDQLSQEEELIAEARLPTINKLTQYIHNKQQSSKKVRLNFICTHNSRRSQIAQIWAHTAAVAYQIPHVETYSGGTEATAFNNWAVRAMNTLGFRIEARQDTGEDQNPAYEVRIGTGLPSLTCYSKKFDEILSPDTPLAAVMTCSDADQNCPLVPGAELRIPLTFDDPKQFDGSGREQKEYLKTALQIGREIIYAFRQVSI